MKYVSINPKTIEFRWTTTQGDFDSYLLVYFNSYEQEVGRQVISKDKTTYSYLDNNPDVMFYSFHTIKGTTMSDSANIEAITATFVQQA